MDLPFDPEKLPTPEKVEEMIETMEELKLFLQRTHQKVIEDKINFLTAGGTTQEFEDAYRARQAITMQGLKRLKSEMAAFGQAVKDTQLVLGAYAFEQAKIVHQALREASKTNPELEEAVREMDALYEDAMREMEEEDEAEEREDE